MNKVARNGEAVCVWLDAHGCRKAATPCSRAGFSSSLTPDRTLYQCAAVDAESNFIPPLHAKQVKIHENSK